MLVLLKKSLRSRVINESLHKLRGLVTPMTYLTLTTYPTPSSLSVCELPLAMTPSAPLPNLQVHERFLFRTVPHNGDLKIFCTYELYVNWSQTFWVALMHIALA